MKRASDHSWKIKLKKCSLDMGEVVLIGHVVYGKGVGAELEKIRRIFKAGSRSIRTELRRFIR